MNTRIGKIADAAAMLFLRQGYARTQIGHIARAAGVSVGSIYLDFAGKKEILHFILKRTLEPGFSEREFERPITDGLFAGLEEEIAGTFERLAAELAGHLENGAGDYPFEALISDAFDLLSRYGVGCLFIERNQADFQELAGYYRAYRRRFFDTVVEYLRIYMAKGEIRALEQVELSATMMIEILSWWAMDMRYTSFEVQNIPVETAKRVCLDHLLAAYLN